MNASRRSWFLIVPALIILAAVFLTYQTHTTIKHVINRRDTTVISTDWQPPDIRLLPASEEARQVLYGKDLIVNTAHYFGPKGTVAAISNGMNCQNCHIDAGLKPFSNCLSGVASTYPVFRPRSGRIESIEFRINDCLRRSLNGNAIDSVSKEMRAMVAFIKWIGKDVRNGEKPKGAGIAELPFLERSADPAKGSLLYNSRCQTCHGKNGQGVVQADSSAYIYPPLWGPQSYNTGAGLYRLSKFAGYIKSSMPFGASNQSPQLTDEQCWDIAAFVNSQPRPHKIFGEDWPVLRLKSFDYPFGPYADTFPERQHKFGPFRPILGAIKR